MYECKVANRKGRAAPEKAFTTKKVKRAKVPGETPMAIHKEIAKEIAELKDKVKMVVREEEDEDFLLMEDLQMHRASSYKVRAWKRKQRANWYFF